MPSGYFETSMVAGPFSKRSTRALVSGSSCASAPTTRAPAKATNAPLRTSIANLVFFIISLGQSLLTSAPKILEHVYNSSAFLESVGQLGDETRRDDIP